MPLLKEATAPDESTCHGFFLMQGADGCEADDWGRGGIQVVAMSWVSKAWV